MEKSFTKVVVDCLTQREITQTPKIKTAIQAALETVPELRNSHIRTAFRSLSAGNSHREGIRAIVILGSVARTEEIGSDLKRFASCGIQTALFSVLELRKEEKVNVIVRALDALPDDEVYP